MNAAFSEKQNGRIYFDPYDRITIGGVSFSRVFTPGTSVSKRTVEKVRKAAAELG